MEFVINGPRRDKSLGDSCSFQARCKQQGNRENKSIPFSEARRHSKVDGKEDFKREGIQGYQSVRKSHIDWSALISRGSKAKRNPHPINWHPQECSHNAFKSGCKMEGHACIQAHRQSQ